MRIIQQLVIRLHLSGDALLLRMIIEPSNNELSFHPGQGDRDWERSRPNQMAG